MAVTTSGAARTAGALALAGAGALAYASLIEARWYTLREVTVPVLPAGQDPLRILHVSDLHLTPGQRKKVDWVRDLASLDPHLVVDTGDNWAHLDAMPALLEALEPHLAVPGAFVLGSNDYVAPTPKNPARYLLPDARLTAPQPPRASCRGASSPRASARPAGSTSPTAATCSRSTAGCCRWSAPTTRTWTATDFPAAGGDDDARTGSTPVDLHLGITHAPYRRVLDAMHADDADLAIAGHTHGGQLALPFWGALVTNCDLDTRRAKGLHGWPGPRPDQPGGAGSTWMHVSAGLGTSPYAPVRFACRPEATLLTLVPVTQR